MSLSQKTMSATPSPVVGKSKPRLLDALGPGLITGASDDDPSGIRRVQQVRLLVELDHAIDGSTDVGRPDDQRQDRPDNRPRLGGQSAPALSKLAFAGVFALLATANTINIGADLGAMADSNALVLGGSKTLYSAVFGGLCIGLQVLLQ